ncbi:Hypothetical predicted protein [Lynx pardinus]|uniref:Core shell protein Gag P30 domain-containing protein n=1 Tax=Lynx pardinus TaxID=191816 RepID=A0A485NG70_LYNPA|nr:Hypothetical predicted protein [Lynx pardinus]
MKQATPDSSIGPFPPVTFTTGKQNARFSDNPKDLIALLDSVMFTHQPTWDDCQQLLRILFKQESCL